VLGGPSRWKLGDKDFSPPPEGSEQNRHAGRSIIPLWATASIIGSQISHPHRRQKEKGEGEGKEKEEKKRIIKGKESLFPPALCNTDFNFRFL